MGSWQPLQPGDPEECGGFRLTHRLGNGGFGTVYLGFRSDIDVPAAVKVFKPAFAASDVWRKRFRREIELIQAMAGVHTAALLDAGGYDDPPWLAMRYVHAPPLDKLIQAYGPFDELCGWWLATSLGEALAEIHAKGILHRDLKPQNILVDRTGVKIIDFGISRFVDGPGVTVDASFFGTDQFAPNEHLLDPRAATEQSDVFALGGVLFYAMTGQLPFQGVTAQQRLLGHLPDLDAVPDQLYSIVEQCLAANLEHRPTALELFRSALDRLTDFAVPLASDSGLPLPAEIRDFVDMWSAEPVPQPQAALASNGSSGPDTGNSSGASGHMGPVPDPEPQPGPVQPQKAAFDSAWRAQWHGAADRRRGRFGKRPGPA